MCPCCYANLEDYAHQGWCPTLAGSEYICDTYPLQTICTSCLKHECVCNREWRVLGAIEADEGEG